MTARLANLVVPVKIGDGTAEIKLTMTEGDARKIANMSDREALGLGPFFVVARDHLIRFLFQNG